MPVLEIDGVGKVEVGKDFLSLSPDRQAAEVDAIAQSLRPQSTEPPQVPGAVPDAAPAQPDGGALVRIAETAKAAFGDQELGMSAETRNKYPGLAIWQPLVAAPADFVVRGLSSVLAGGSAAIAEVAKKAGMSDADANRLTRDLYVIGQGALVESGMGPKSPRAGAAPEAVAKPIDATPLE